MNYHLGNIELQGRYLYFDAIVDGKGRVVGIVMSSPEGEAQVFT